MNYQEVTVEKAKEILQSTYKYMPTFTSVNGSMVRIVAQINGTYFYTKEKI